jgi:hypothetical protein
VGRTLVALVPLVAPQPSTQGGPPAQLPICLRCMSLLDDMIGMGPGANETRGRLAPGLRATFEFWALPDCLLSLLIDSYWLQPFLHHVCLPLHHGSVQLPLHVFSHSLCAAAVSVRWRSPSLKRKVDETMGERRLAYPVE